MRRRDLQRELERLARSQPGSGRAAQAKASALRTLERLNRSGFAGYPTDDDGRFHPGGPGWWDLDRCDSDETRERWRLAWLADRIR